MSRCELILILESAKGKAAKLDGYRSAAPVLHCRVQWPEPGLALRGGHSPAFCPCPCITGAREEHHHWRLFVSADLPWPLWPGHLAGLVPDGIQVGPLLSGTQCCATCPRLFFVPDVGMGCPL